MPSFAELIQQGSTHAWLFIPSAILLGALHGLEPGHSKTMMAAFIVAVRGTVKQAVLLGLAATVSHTLIVWAIALGGLYLWRGVSAEALEPYFQIASAVIIIAMAAWMLWRVAEDQRRATAAAGHGHPHDGHLHGSHGHSHGEDIRRIDTGHGIVAVEVFEDGVPPRWRVRSERGHAWRASDVRVETERPDGRRQTFAFADRGGYLESIDEIPEPHEFMARVSLGLGGHSHDYEDCHPHGAHLHCGTHEEHGPDDHDEYHGDEHEHDHAHGVPEVDLVSRRLDLRSDWADPFAGVERLRIDAPLNDWDPKTFYTQGAEGYTDYPALETVA